ncbi:hypothetical protein GCM10022377_11260 [Zhihengliuella alba]|uniref:LytR/CpsA/Psr regulator C-terminal domain-containing protein n=1 Tax=Zhihengliuella alba TaxID=547018 RepID=A0ABP7D2G5_9MICC
MSKYPSDEFDRVPEYTDRQGVHRLDAGMAPVKRGGLWPLMLFGVAALIIGIVAFTLLRPQFGAEPTAGSDASSSATQSGEPAAESSEGDDGGSPAAEDGQDGAGQGGEDGGDASDPATGEDEQSEQPGESGAVDQGIAVGVYNASTEPGLAGTRADALRAAGYTEVVTGNWTRQVEPTVVYYRGEASAATARAIADELGIATIYQTENIPLEISVVLGTVN